MHWIFIINSSFILSSIIRWFTKTPISGHQSSALARIRTSSGPAMGIVIFWRFVSIDTLARFCHLFQGTGDGFSSIFCKHRYLSTKDKCSLKTSVIVISPIYPILSSGCSCVYGEEYRDEYGDGYVIAHFAAYHRGELHRICRNPSIAELDGQSTSLVRTYAGDRGLQ